MTKMSGTTTVVQGFWLATCGYDTHHRGPGNAQQETPWNRLSGNGILVATVWSDEIVDVLCDGAIRRFIHLGGKMKAWQSHAVTHGREAEANLNEALDTARRIVGYEAEPYFVQGTKRVKRFHMDRHHELVPIFSRSSLIEELGLYRRLAAKNPELADALRMGTVFELKELAGPLPGPDPDPAPPGAVIPAGGEEDPVTVANMADLALPLLVRHVRAQYDGAMAVMTYARLAELLGWLDRDGRPHARGVGAALKVVMRRVDAAGEALGSCPPLLTAVVVAGSGPNEGMPESGIDARWPGYATLRPDEKRTRVQLEYARIIAYGAAWNALLAHLGLVISGGGGIGGGESPAHRSLKEFVLANPHRFGVDFGAEGSVEYALKSGDSIDVFFKTHTKWTGIEVKSSLSDEADIERGVYQVVKYGAVLIAQGREHKAPPAVRVALVMEGALPDHQKMLAKRLNVEVIDCVSPASF